MFTTLLCRRSSITASLLASSALVFGVLHPVRECQYSEPSRVGGCPPSDGTVGRHSGPLRTRPAAHLSYAVRLCQGFPHAERALRHARVHTRSGPLCHDAFGAGSPTPEVSHQFVWQVPVRLPAVRSRRTSLTIRPRSWVTASHQPRELYEAHEGC